MSIKPQYENYRYIGEVGQLQSQSMVECRLPGSEISSILAVQAVAVVGECACADGVVNYGGKVLFHVVYEDGDRKICRAERGVEFFHKAEGGMVSPACFAKAELLVENVAHRREGSGLYISAVVNARLMVYGNKQIEYLVGGEALMAQSAPVCVHRSICVSGELQSEDEFETDYVGDVLLHTERAVVHHVNADAGQIDLEGELVVNICVLKSEEEICSYERLLHFQMQIPCEEAFGKVTVGAKVQVKSAHLTAGTDEEKGKSKMLLDYVLSADCFVSMQEEFNGAQDVFSCTEELHIKKAKDGGRYLTKHLKCTERVSGVAVLSPAMEGEYTLQACVLPRAEVVCRQKENGFEIEGVAQANVLVCGADGAHRSAELSLPFMFFIDGEGSFAEADCLVCGLNVRKKKTGEMEAEATLKMGVRVYEERTWEYICEVNEGEKYEENDSAFSVFLPQQGEGLWEVAKRLHCSPEVVQKSNPDLEFPVKDGQKIYIYRQI